MELATDAQPSFAHEILMVLDDYETCADVEKRTQ